MTTIRIIAGETVTLSATVTSDGVLEDITTGYVIDLHIAPPGDATGVIIDRGTAGTTVDVATSGADGVALCVLDTTDTGSLSPGDYTGQWRVQNALGNVEIDEFTLSVALGLHS